MATADEVTVVLQAKTDTYLRNIKAAETQFVKGLDRIENEADQAGAALSRVGTVGAGQMSRGLKRVDGQLQQVGRRFGAAGNQVGNLGAQINDIGVTLASGQSPFLIAVQQGSQINQVIGHLGAAGAVRALAASFTSLINPVSLATFAIIGLGGTAVQYFTQLLTSTEEADQKLEDHKAVIQGVADKWGEAVPALREYADELRKTAEAADLRQVAGLAAGAEFDELSSLAADASAAIGEVVNEAYRLGTVPVQSLNVLNSQFTQLQNAIDDLEAEYRAGNNTTEEMQAVSAALATILGNNLVEGSDSAVGAINRLSEALGIATGNAQSLVDSVKELEGRGNIPFSEFEGGRGSDPRSFEDDPYWKSRYFPDPEKPDRTPSLGRGSRGGRGGGGGASAIDRQREAVAKLIETLEHEHSLIGLTDVEREKANNLRRAGAAATDEQRAKIAQLTETIYNEKTAIEEQERAFKQLQQIGEDAISGIANAFQDGKIEAEELIGILANVAQQLLRMKSISGGGAGGFLGSILGAVIPGFANGTNYAPGGMAIVGEKGPELVNLPRGSQVVPNQRIDVGGTSVNMPVTINAPGADAAQLARVREELRQLRENVPKMVDQREHTKQTRGTRA